jgi:hydrogenase maturation protease
MAVMYRARRAQRLIIIDAREPDGQPGAAFRVPGDMLVAAPQHGAGLHAFLWDHALFVCRKLFGDAFPGDVEVILIEAASLDFSIELSDPVARAAEAVAAMLSERFLAADV